MTHRILIVDDHRLVRDGLRRTLRDAGYRVMEADTAERGLELAQRSRPHLVLLDVSLPGMDGISALRNFATRVPHLPVMMLTMHDDDDLVLRAREAGARGYLLKTASTDELLLAVARVLAGHTLFAGGDHPGLDHPGPADNGSSNGQKGLSDRTGKLTHRELQVLQLLADVGDVAGIARALVISPKTVRNHLSRVYEKLDVTSSSQAIVVGLQRDLIQLPPQGPTS